MCIRYCDDGWAAGVPDVMAALALDITVFQIWQYLNYASAELDELLGGGGDRADTIEYLRWYPNMWNATHHYDEFVRLYNDDL